MHVILEEQETVISFGRLDERAQVYTTDSIVRTKMHHLLEREGSEWTLERQERDAKDHDIVAEVFSCPKSLISFRTAKKKERIMTEEQRKAVAERLRNLRKK